MLESTMNYIKTPSKYQQAIFDFVIREQGNLIINAVAGSGKSSTLIHLLGLVKRALMLAFNKHIVEELKDKVPSHVEVRTFHSLCYRPVMDYLHIRKVNQDKLWNLQSSIFVERDQRIYGAFTRKLVGLARQSGLDVLAPLNDVELLALIERHDLELEHEDANEGRAIELTIKLLRASNESPEADFDDLLYFPVLKGITLPRFPVVLVDESQDTNAIQRALLRKILGQDGRLVAVGDTFQSIYGFRGADSAAMQLIEKDFKCVQLPLSITYRCPKKVVERAKAYVPQIEAAPTAIDGEVLDLAEKWKPQDFGKTDLVICRNNKPLVSLGYQMLRARIPVRILGREIGEGLITLAKKCDGNRNDLDHMLERLEAWRRREVEKAEARNQSSKAQLVEDKADSLRAIADELMEDERTTDRLIAVLTDLFADGNGRTTLSTIHKAKGLEADVIWWLCPSLCPSRWARQEWQQQQEKNIQYIAITRAKKKLVMIEMPDSKGIGTSKTAQERAGTTQAAPIVLSMDPGATIAPAPSQQAAAPLTEAK